MVDSLLQYRVTVHRRQIQMQVGQISTQQFWILQVWRIFCISEMPATLQISTATYTPWVKKHVTKLLFISSPNITVAQGTVVMHLRCGGIIRSSMDHSTTVSVALALVSSRLDYVNSIISGSPLKQIARLQRAQHALARVVLQERSRARSAPLMQQLHWLPIEWRITLTYKALQTGRPISCRPYTVSHNFKVHTFIFHSATIRSTS